MFASTSATERKKKVFNSAATTGRIRHPSSDPEVSVGAEHSAPQALPLVHATGDDAHVGVGVSVGLQLSKSTGNVFLSIIYEYPYKARVFVSLGWISFPRTNTLAW